jgi:hypothetical protein
MKIRHLRGANKRAHLEWLDWLVMTPESLQSCVDQYSANFCVELAHAAS